jgi:putative DNA primase/helicase
MLANAGHNLNDFRGRRGVIRTSEFLSVFREPGEPLHLRAFKPKKAENTTENYALLWDTSLAELAASQELQSALIEANKTRGVYFGVNVGGATDDSITRYTAFFAEADNNSISEQHAAFDAAPLKPSIRVESRNSVHGYYLIPGECSESEWRSVQEGLIAHFDSDPKIKNPSRVMRLPNFDHVHLNGSGLERKKVIVHTFESERRYTVAEMREAFPAPKPEVPSQDASDLIAFENHEDRHQELCQRIMSRGKRNSKNNWDAQGRCHNGKGDKGLVYFPSSGAVKCNAEPACDYWTILRAEGLLDHHLPSLAAADKFVVEESSDEAVMQELAALTPLEFDRRRKTEAKKLGVRPATLDKLVAALRPKSEGELQGRGIDLGTIEHWAEPVDGASVLNEVAQTFSRYLALPPGAADVLAVWAAHTHVFDAFDFSPRLNLSSPEKGCGKTTARDVVGLFVPRPLATENLSVAVLFRIIESQQPTLLADECDAWVNDNEELRGLLNAGHRRGGQALRCEGEGNEVRAFNVFAPAVLCGIGSLPGTLHDRSIVIRLERAKPGELRHRFDSRHTKREQELRRKLARWCADNRELIKSHDPVLPEAAFNRVGDNWRPMFAAAEVAGGDWPQRIADAFAKLVRQEDADAQGLAIMLLADIQTVFADKKTDRLFSKELVDALCAMEDRPWPEARRDKPITAAWLSRRLRPFRIFPKSLRIEPDNAKGYELGAFQEAFTRYLPSKGESNRHNVTSRINIDENAKSNRHNETVCDDSENVTSRINIGLCRCDAFIPPKGSLKSEEDVIRAEREAIEWEGSQRSHE